MLEEISNQRYELWRVFYEVVAQEAEQANEEAMQEARRRR